MHHNPLLLCRPDIRVRRHAHVTSPAYGAAQCVPGTRSLNTSKLPPANGVPPPLSPSTSTYKISVRTPSAHSIPATLDALKNKPCTVPAALAPLPTRSRLPHSSPLPGTCISFPLILPRLRPLPLPPSPPPSESKYIPKLPRPAPAHPNPPLPRRGRVALPASPPRSPRTSPPPSAPRLSDVCCRGGGRVRGRNA